MRPFVNRFVILSVTIFYSIREVYSLTCRCDDGPQCKSGSCQANSKIFGPSHCELSYDPTVNGDRAWRGCNLANSFCDIVSENRAVDVTFTNGKLSSFGGCCSDDNCDGDVLESSLNLFKNSTCKPLSANENSTSAAVSTSADFSCHCDPTDMIALFDLSVERGLQWLAGQSVSNASHVYDNSTRLRQRMSNFCTNNMCNANTMIAGGVVAPVDSFPVCAHFVRSDTGKAVRGCTFAPRNNFERDSARRLQSGFPANPIAGTYDVRVGFNASDRYNFIFECRSDMCNERQFYENIISQCLPGVDMVTKPQLAVEPLAVPPVGGPSGTTGGPSVTAQNMETGLATTPGADSEAGQQNVAAHEQMHHNTNETGHIDAVMGSQSNATETPVVVESTPIVIVANGTAAPTEVKAKDVTTATPHATTAGASGSFFHLLCIVPMLVLAGFH